MGGTDVTKKEEESIPRFCMECGECVEEDAEFCYSCGSRRIITVNPVNNRVVLKKGECPYCGHMNVEDAKFCASCGRRIGEFEYSGRRNRKLTGRDYAAIGLALIPGAVNIFGLGHLLLGRISRGIMYLLMSAILLYIIYGTGEVKGSMYILLEVIGFVIYFKQAMEIVGLVQNQR